MARVLPSIPLIMVDFDFSNPAFLAFLGVLFTLIGYLVVRRSKSVNISVDVVKLVREQTALLAKLGDREAKLLQHENTISVLFDKIEHMEARIDALNAEADGYEKVREKIRRENAQLRRQVASFEKRIKDLEDFIHQLGATPPPPPTVDCSDGQ